MFCFTNIYIPFMFCRYLDEIKHPMDLGTMEKKLERGEYSTMDEFASDMQLIFANCRQFNPPMTIPCQHADIMERAWRKEWARALVRRLEYTEKRALSGMLSRLRAHPTSGLFLTAVDPVALGIPTYFDIIPRKDARDLSLINEKLKNDQYNSIEALDADVRLMLKNCYTFNQADEVVCGLAKNFEGVYEKEMRAVRASLTGPNASTSVGKAGGGGAGNKRPNKEMSGASSNKKSKLG